MSEHAPFDPRAVRRHRDRAASRVARVAPILDEAADRLVGRLDDTTRRFGFALDLGGRGAVSRALAARGIAHVSADVSAAMAAANGGLRVAIEGELLPFAPGAFDLVVASMSLHWTNDLVGALIQLRHALAPGGLLLASLPVLDTLGGLRRALFATEESLRGGAAARVSPLPLLQDCAGLLQRAGYALPVADLERISLAYASPLSLIDDLRAAGETNALRLRDRRPPPRALFPMALASLAPDGTHVALDLELAMLTGWAPDG